MAGIYIHVPFCRKACHYCDFYFTVSLKYIDDYVEALLAEFLIRKKEGENTPVKTIYLGGGTPSVLEKDHLSRILDQISGVFGIDDGAELTIEANPDDLERPYLIDLRELGFRRLSIGVQSFHQSDLELMNRSHSAEQSSRSILQAKEAGIDNINMDLIYGLPGLSQKGWEKNLKTTMELPVNHISAYHLTYEPRTVFHHWRKKGRLTELPEDTSIEQYMLLREITAVHGFEHYEISNFALPGFRSEHNSTYWSGQAYLGFGPSAHSFMGNERRWNVASLGKYIQNIKDGSPMHESEQLSIADQYNETLITSLRTDRGVDLQIIRERYGEDAKQDLLERATVYIQREEMKREEDILKMTPEGWLRSDLIISNLMIDE